MGKFAAFAINLALPIPFSADILKSMQTEGYSTWLEIDLGAIKSNINQLQKIAGVPVMAVVKANGYGHGSTEVAQAACQAGASWCGVARIEEALALRSKNITAPILVMGFTDPKYVPLALQNRISLCLYDLEIARAYGELARHDHATLQVHAKFDTGMGRLGVFPEDGTAFIEQLGGIAGLEIEGIFTHMARADESDRQTTLWQIGRFQALVNSLQSKGLKPRLIHAANSAATLFYPQARFDLVRCGISIYGLHPSAETPNPVGFKPALAWKTRLTSLKYMPPEHGISYNHRYKTLKREFIGVIPVGYADGFRRRLGNSVLLHGKRARVVGTVCMDQAMLQLDHIPEARLGDEVVLLGRQGEEAISAEDIAADWGTNNYEVVCGLANRLPRIYRENES
jgi:alanine racemase